jgi:archaellum component FlaC
MSQKEIAEIQKILTEISTTLGHVSADVAEIKIKVETQGEKINDIDKDVSGLQGSYSVIKYLVLTSLGIGIAAGIKVFLAGGV